LSTHDVVRTNCSTVGRQFYYFLLHSPNPEPSLHPIRKQLQQRTPTDSINGPFWSGPQWIERGFRSVW
jgi:hypothetical protein